MCRLVGWMDGVAVEMTWPNLFATVRFCRTFESNTQASLYHPVHVTLLQTTRLLFFFLSVFLNTFRFYSSFFIIAALQKKSTYKLLCTHMLFVCLTFFPFHLSFSSVSHTLVQLKSYFFIRFQAFYLTRKKKRIENTVACLLFVTKYGRRKMIHWNATTTQIIKMKWNKNEIKQIRAWNMSWRANVLDNVAEFVCKNRVTLLNIYTYIETATYDGCPEHVTTTRIHCSYKISKQKHHRASTKVNR